jgi:hypothetical protein
MKNVSMTVKGHKLTIVVDLMGDFGPSSSGKTVIVASTNGPAEIEGHPSIKLGLNVYKKPTKP